MTIYSKYYILLFVVMLFVACKKNDSKHSFPLKSIELIKGNNQIGYANQNLHDSIVIKVVPSNPDNISKYSYKFVYNRQTSSISQFKTEQKDGAIYIKAAWLPSIAGVSEIKFYTYFNCLNTDCKPTDSLTITAFIRQPWTIVYSRVDELMDLCFRDDKFGIAVGEHGRLTTNDGGNTWSKDDSFNVYLNHITFVGIDTGLAVTVTESGAFTYDGGKTFVFNHWGRPPYTTFRSSSEYYLVNSHTIFSVGTGGHIAKSLNAGESWKQYQVPGYDGTLTDIAHADGDTYYVCGVLGKVLKTTDAGNTWQVIDVKTKSNLEKAYFYSKDFGFLAGEKGTLLRTADGGEHWSGVKTGISFAIKEVKFFSETEGAIVSESGEIAVTTDGGITWSEKNPLYYGNKNSFTKIIIKDNASIYSVIGSAIFKYDLSQK